MKGYIFDFGGTLDTNGCHWGKFIWHAYERQHVPVNWEQFREAYIFAEQQLGKNAIILPTDSFRQTLDKKLRIEMERLVTQGYWYSSPLEVERLHAAVLDDLYSRVCEHVTCGREVLLRLKPQYPLVLCSNFYGNLTEVLKEFQLDGLFQDVVESAVVGIRKPDVRIYELALRSLGGVEAAADVVVVGDSLKNDIRPARQIGCQTIWLKGEPWDSEAPDNSASYSDEADRVITNILDLI
ncbi:MAG: HAD family hydrolase [Prevotella sp.]|nr:HAD family hydrolase [Prevotella sp.]